MCGILGAVPAVDQGAFRHALGLLTHRGPDGEGVFQEAEHVLLGHRRLAIVDLSPTGRQPMCYRNRYAITFNGEIYNFPELREQLEGTGISFHTASDTEVLLAAFDHWGPACLERFNGMWAFAIWDSQERTLFLSRDRIGKKPLFYLHRGDGFVFASEQKALLPFAEFVRPSPNFKELCRNAYEYESTSATLFDGIQRLPAAHYANLKDGKLTIRPYWAPLETQAFVPKDFESQVERLQELMLDATAIRMRADVPIGTGLSGGVDSSAIAACVAEVGRREKTVRLSPDWQNAFVASFPGTAMDETAHAATVAKHIGIPLNRVTIDAECAANQLEHWTFQFEEVHEVNPIPHIQLYQAMRQKGVVVSLDGHGGDELFCGYESSILQALPDAAPRLSDLRMVLDTYHASHPKNAQFRGMTIPRIALHLARSRVRQLRRVSGPYACQDLDSLNRHLKVLTFETVLPTLLRNYDRYSMISGVEVRMPLLDHRLIDFAFALPWQAKIRAGFTKAVLRNAAAPWLPTQIVSRRDKIGFAPPIIDWMRGPLRTYLLDELESQSFKQATLVTPASLATRIRDLLAGENRSTLYQVEQTWKQFNIYLWEKVFIQRGTHKFAIAC